MTMTTITSGLIERDEPPELGPRQSDPTTQSTHRGVPPELDQVMNVRGGCQQEEIAPLIIADCQRSILVHSGNDREVNITFQFT